MCFSCPLLTVCHRCHSATTVSCTLSGGKQIREYVFSFLKPRRPTFPSILCSRTNYWKSPATKTSYEITLEFTLLSSGLSQALLSKSYFLCLLCNVFQLLPVGKSCEFESCPHAGRWPQICKRRLKHRLSMADRCVPPSSPCYALWEEAWPSAGLRERLLQNAETGQQKTLWTRQVCTGHEELCADTQPFQMQTALSVTPGTVISTGISIIRQISVSRHEGFCTKQQFKRWRTWRQSTCEGTFLAMCIFACKTESFLAFQLEFCWGFVYIPMFVASSQKPT